LFETEERVRPAIHELRTLYAEQHPTQPLTRDDDAFLLRFLRARKFRMPDAVAYAPRPPVPLTNTRDGDTER
jgi:hypothetical protein